MSTKSSRSPWLEGQHARSSDRDSDRNSKSSKSSRKSEKKRDGSDLSDKDSDN